MQKHKGKMLSGLMLITSLSVTIMNYLNDTSGTTTVTPNSSLNYNSTNIITQLINSPPTLNQAKQGVSIAMVMLSSIAVVFERHLSKIIESQTNEISTLSERLSVHEGTGNEPIMIPSPTESENTVYPTTLKIQK